MPSHLRQYVAGCGLYTIPDLCIPEVRGDEMGWSLGSHQVLKKSSFGHGIVRACLSNFVWLGAVLVGAFGAGFLLKSLPVHL